jgi:predicted glycosyltransferase
MSPKDMKRLRALAAARRRLKVIDFAPEPLSFIRKAESVVSMGGYNAVCEIISFRKRALIIPRVWPRKEQLVRAERLRELGLVEMAHPDEFEPDVITDFLRKEGHGLPRRGVPIDMDGLAKVSSLAESLLATKGIEVGAIPFE